MRVLILGARGRR